MENYRENCLPDRKVVGERTNIQSNPSTAPDTANHPYFAILIRYKHQVPSILAKPIIDNQLFEVSHAHLFIASTDRSNQRLHNLVAAEVIGNDPVVDDCSSWYFHLNMVVKSAVKGCRRKEILPSLTSKTSTKKVRHSQPWAH